MIKRLGTVAKVAVGFLKEMLNTCKSINTSVKWCFHIIFNCFLFKVGLLGKNVLKRKIIIVVFCYFHCILGNLELNNSCELTEQCIQPFSGCFQGKCKCINGYSAFETDSCLKGL